MGAILQILYVTVWTGGHFQKIQPETDVNVTRECLWAIRRNTSSPSQWWFKDAWGPCLKLRKGRFLYIRCSYTVLHFFADLGIGVPSPLNWKLGCSAHDHWVGSLLGQERSLHFNRPDIHQWSLQRFDYDEINFQCPFDIILPVSL